MRLQLSDTTSDAIRFLLVGAGTLFILRLAYVGISRLNTATDPTELEALISKFQNGYWLTDPNTVVTAGMGVGERIALAVVISAVLASLVALIVYMVLRASGRSGGVTVVRAARLTLILSVLWFTYAALIVPPRTARFLPEEIALVQRPAVLGELSLPWPASTSNYTWSAIDGLEITTSENSEDQHSELVAVHGMDLLLLTSGPDELGTERLAEALRATYLEE